MRYLSLEYLADLTPSIYFQEEEIKEEEKKKEKGEERYSEG